MSRVANKLRENADNQACADCSQPVTASVAWATTTFGAFVCIQCAGVHRNLGVKISRIKSVHMDTWSADEVALMKGNRAVNAVLEKHVAPAVKAAVNQSDGFRAAYIQAKYAAKTFASPDGAAFQLPPTATAPLSSSPSSSSSSKWNNGMSSVDVAKRFVNYFVVVGRGSSLKQTGDIQFQPTILDNYPETLADAPLPPHIAQVRKHIPVFKYYPVHPSKPYVQFAFPERLTLSATFREPTFFSFVLTNVSGAKIYRLSLSEAPLPLERYVANFVSEIPVNFRPLFQMLDLNNVLAVFTCLLLEQKVALCSKHLSVLTPIAESLQALLFPLYWQGAYIPILPSSLLDIIDVFDPFAPEIAKADWAFDHQEYRTPAVVDGTTGGRILHPTDADRKASLSLDRKATLSFQTLKMLVPSPSASVLTERSASISTGTGGSSSPSAFQTDAVRQAFFRFFVSMFKRYAAYLMFQRFCYDRSADADNVPADVRFFDASIYQKLNRSMTLGKKYDVSFLEDKAESIRETYVAPPPSTMGLPDNGMRYMYRGFPRLKRCVVEPGTSWDATRKLVVSVSCY
ncbi:hypothetical protein DYB28_002857 [Aphanomyces astaci]|uniref:Arf-GAP domain-containing protein n=1 Tax=Aphanomyces astaci TaxID=112090 RepID=A0A9X8EDZ1_APHAT|nr:hypothetical protein DYB28_002857 [Aphanomyces astaci]